jgi:tetratricopeptide (TPR) repeat protein
MEEKLKKFPYLDRNNDRFVFNSIPPHFLYYVHPGKKVTSDIDYQSLEKFLARYVGQEATLLKNLSPDQLEETTIALHNVFFPGDNSYRETCVNVPFPDSPRSPQEAREKLKNSWKHRADDLRLFIEYQDKTIYIAKRLFIRLAADNNHEFNMHLAKYLGEHKSKLILFSELPTSDDIVIEELIRRNILDGEIENAALNIVQSDEILVSKYQRAQALEAQTKPLLEYSEHEQGILLEALATFAFYGVLPDKILCEIKQFYIDLYNKLQSSDPIETAAWVCLEYTRIHPMENANGRVSRLLGGIILMQTGILPCVMDNDEEYMSCLRKSKNDYTIFAEFYYGKIERMADKYKSNPADYYQTYECLDKNIMLQLIMKLNIGIDNFSEGRDLLPLSLLGVNSMTVDYTQITKHAGTLFRNGKKQEVEGNYNDAVRLAEEAFKKYQMLPFCEADKIAIIFHAKANAYFHQGQYEQALADSAKAMAIMGNKTGILKDAMSRLRAEIEQKREIVEVHRPASMSS